MLSGTDGTALTAPEIADARCAAIGILDGVRSDPIEPEPRPRHGSVYKRRSHVDNDGQADLELFYRSDSNTNEAGLFTLDLTRAP